MKKCIVILLVMATLILCLAGCGGKKATAVVTFESDNVVSLPISGMKNIGVQFENNQIMTVNMRKEGVYPIPLLADGTAYTFTITYENGKYTAEVDPDLAFTIQ